MNKKIIFSAIAVLAIALAAALYFANRSAVPAETPDELTEEGELTAKALFTCDNGKTIDVAFFEGEEIPVEPGEPPVPTGTARAVFSNGIAYELLQTISASGARYATKDESLVFWNKGDEATIYENGEVSSDWTNCGVRAEEGAVFCTMDAKACPDCSFVGRQGPDCEFAPCPGE